MKTFTIRMSDEMLGAVENLARRHGRTTAEEARLALRMHCVNGSLAVLSSPDGIERARADGIDVDAYVEELKREYVALMDAVFIPAPLPDVRVMRAGVTA